MTSAGVRLTVHDVVNDEQEVFQLHHEFRQILHRHLQQLQVPVQRSNRICKIFCETLKRSNNMADTDYRILTKF